MLASNRFISALLLSCATQGAMAQLLSVTEASQKQSELARVEMDVKLAEARTKLNNVLAPPTPFGQLSQQNQKKEEYVDELISLISVYGVDSKLKADFLVQGTVVTLEKGGKTTANGWRLEQLSATEALLTKKTGRNIKRKSVYLSAISAQNRSESIQDGFVTQEGRFQNSIPLPNSAGPVSLPMPSK